MQNYLEYLDGIQKCRAMPRWQPDTLCGVMGKATGKWHGLEWKGIEHTDLKELAEAG